MSKNKNNVVNLARRRRAKQRAAAARASDAELRRYIMPELIARCILDLTQENFKELLEKAITATEPPALAFQLTVALREVERLRRLIAAMQEQLPDEPRHE